MLNMMKFLPGDVVTPRFKGEPFKTAIVDSVEKVGWFKKRITVSYYATIPKRTDVFKTTRAFVNSNTFEYSFHFMLKLYQLEHELIRPIEAGDTIYLADDLNVFYSTNDLAYLGKGKVVKMAFDHFDIVDEVNSRTRLYMTHDRFSYIDANLDIPRTNRGLMMKYKPKLKKGLPTI